VFVSALEGEKGLVNWTKGKKEGDGGGQRLPQKGLIKGLPELGLKRRQRALRRNKDSPRMGGGEVSNYVLYGKNPPIQSGA